MTKKENSTASSKGFPEFTSVNSHLNQYEAAVSTIGQQINEIRKVEVILNSSECKTQCKRTVALSQDVQLQARLTNELQTTVNYLISATSHPQPPPLHNSSLNANALPSVLNSYPQSLKLNNSDGQSAPDRDTLSAAGKPRPVSLDEESKNNSSSNPSGQPKVELGEGHIDFDHSIAHSSSTRTRENKERGDEEKETAYSPIPHYIDEEGGYNSQLGSPRSTSSWSDSDPSAQQTPILHDEEYSPQSPQSPFTGSDEDDFHDHHHFSDPAQQLNFNQVTVNHHGNQSNHPDHHHPDPLSPYTQVPPGFSGSSSWRERNNLNNAEVEGEGDDQGPPSPGAELEAAFAEHVRSMGSFDLNDTTNTSGNGPKSHLNVSGNTTGENGVNEHERSLLAMLDKDPNQQRNEWLRSRQAMLKSITKFKMLGRRAKRAVANRKQSQLTPEHKSSSSNHGVNSSNNPKNHNNWHHRRQNLLAELLPSHELLLHTFRLLPGVLTSQPAAVTDLTSLLTDAGFDYDQDNVCQDNSNESVEHMLLRGVEQVCARWKQAHMAFEIWICDQLSELINTWTSPQAPDQLQTLSQRLAEDRNKLFTALTTQGTLLRDDLSRAVHTSWDASGFGTSGSDPAPPVLISTPVPAEAETVAETEEPSVPTRKAVVAEVREEREAAVVTQQDLENLKAVAALAAGEHIPTQRSQSVTPPSLSPAQVPMAVVPVADRKPPTEGVRATEAPPPPQQSHSHAVGQTHTRAPAVAMVAAEHVSHATALSPIPVASVAQSEEVYVSSKPKSVFNKLTSHVGSSQSQAETKETKEAKVNAEVRKRSSSLAAMKHAPVRVTRGSALGSLMEIDWSLYPNEPEIIQSRLSCTASRLELSGQKEGSSLLRASGTSGVASPVKQ